MFISRSTAIVFFTFLSALSYQRSWAQAGGTDPTFNPGAGADGAVYGLAVQPDGKILAVGAFTTFNGISRNGIVRLNTDGSVDTTFDPGTGAVGVKAVTIRNGEIVIGGNFSTVDGETRFGVARLNTDGSVDPTFNGSGSGVAVGIYSDRKVVIGGIGGFPPHRGVLRYLPDGQVDEAFAIAVDRPLGQVWSLAIQQDDKTLFGGSFTSVNGQPRFRLARANADGTLDDTFIPEGGSLLEVSALAVQDDGRIYQGGYMLSRLTSTGSLDAGFRASQFNGRTTRVGAIAVQPDRKAIVVGNFTTIEDWETGAGADRNRVARLNSDGTLDQSFGNGLALADNMVTTVALQADGGILVGGMFGTMNGVLRSGIARLLGDAEMPDVPELNVRKINRGRIVVSWPVTPGPWTLEVSKHPKRNDWKPVTNPIATVDGINYVTNKVSGGKFFRLR